MLELNLLMLVIENKPTFILFYIIINAIVTDGSVTRSDVLTHLIIVILCSDQMLCQSILFFICWFMMLKNHVGTKESPSAGVISLCLLLI